MKPDIKELWSSNTDDLAQWVPATLEAVLFPLALTIGPPDTPAGETFQLQVATPEAIRAHAHLGACFLARHWLIVRDYHWPEVVATIEQRVAACEGDTWEEIALKLARWFAWEFEDYQPWTEEDQAEEDALLADESFDDSEVGSLRRGL